jgi:hypothetical protein
VTKDDWVLPCPLHADCELYLKEEDCEYRSREISYEEAEGQAYFQSGLSARSDGFADNE